MSEQLSLQNIEHEFIRATDYKEIAETDLDQLCEPNKLNQPFFTRGALACALSHLEAYKRIVEEGLDVALVLEDDVELGKDFKLLLAKVEKEIGQDEIISFIYFMHSGQHSFLSNVNSKKIDSQYGLFYPVDIEGVECAMAYVITRNVAEKMLKVNYPVFGPADYWGGFYTRNAFSSFRCVFPFPVGVAPFRTTIDYANSKSLKSKLAAIVRRYKFPALYSYLLKRDKKLLEQKSFSFSDDPPFLK